MINGYVQAERNADSFYSDEHGNGMITGDQAKMDEDGLIHITGRYKDLIIRGGENVSPATIEQLINEHPNLTSQVVGIPDEVSGELPVAVVQRHESDTPFRPTELKRELEERLGSLFAPHHVIDLYEDLGLY